MVQTLGMEIKIARVRAGLSQAALGRLLGKATPQLVHHWEQDHLRPSKRYMGKIRAFLATDPNVLKWSAHRAGIVPPRKGKARTRRTKWTKKI